MRHSLIVASAVVACSIFGRSTPTGPTPPAADIADLENLPASTVLEPRYFQMFPKSVQNDRVDFAERLEEPQHVHIFGAFAFGSGSQAHEVGRNECAWTLDRRSRKAAAIMMVWFYQPGVKKDWEEFRIYGASWETLPEPLAAWGRARGMQASNALIYIEPTKR